MSRQLHQSQYILQKCFDNRQNVIRVSMNNAQDYLNAIYDASKDALRVNMVGGMLPIVDDPNDLPSHAADNQIAPVYNAEKDVIDFYEWSEELGEWVYRGSTISGNALEGDEKQAVEWVTEHLDQLKEVADYNYIVNVSDVHLDPNNRVVEVQGQLQDIDDDLNSDSDDTTPYRIDFSGYVLSVSTYADNNAPIPDNYGTQITYESGTGGLGTSHIFLKQEEFDYYASLQDGKNIIRVYYLTNATSTPIRKKRLVLNQDGTAVDEEGENYVISDSGDTDGDPQTIYCIDVAGYVLGTETFANDDALVPDKCYLKINYESDGVYSGRSHIYMDKEAFDAFSKLGNGKNIIDIYYLQKVFPASVTISEIQYMFPSDSVDYVAMDASGNIKNITDYPDKDGDETTHVRITVNGYAIDMAGYYNDNDPIKHRLIVKMSYNHDVDTTDIYLDRDHYDYVSTLRNGRNIVSIYTVGAGLGVDASRIPIGASKVHVWKGKLDSVEGLSQVENPENGDTWQVGAKEYSWNGYEWVELGDTSEYMRLQRPIVHSDNQLLYVTPGGCYRWTVNGQGQLFMNDVVDDTMSWTYVDIVMGENAEVEAVAMTQMQSFEKGKTNRCRIDCDGSGEPRLYVYEIL